MKIYIDLVFFINFMFDFLILLTVKIVLKKVCTIKKILLSSLIGSLSIFVLFININSFELFLIKLIISIIMILISFGYRDFFKSIIYLYFISIVLGGFIYYLNNCFSYKVNGLVFIHNGFSINIVLIFILSPIILYFYIKQNKELNFIKNTNYIITFSYNRKKYTYKGFLDTGNKLHDMLNRPVIILYDKSFKLRKNEKVVYANFNTINSSGLIKCIKINNMNINDKLYKNVVIGLSNTKFNLKDCDMIINPDVLM